MLVEWNNTHASYPEDACLHQLVERQAERTPEAVGVVFGDAQLTYRELNRRANQLAHRLRVLGVGPETLVGICVEPSFEMVIGLVGVLKAGGAYVPLDPTYPVERLAFVLDDARPSVLVTQSPLLDRLPPHGAPVLCLDRDRGTWEAEPDGNPAMRTTPDNLAYVIYTSGSTGRPKGVEVPHRGVVNYLTFLAKTYGLGPADAVLQVTSISFDTSVRSIFAPLTTGARLVLMPGREMVEPLAVLVNIRRHSVTRIVAIIPSILRLLVAVAEGTGLAAESLRTLLVSAEPLHLSDVTRARKIAPNALIVNHYGPTETTMTSTCYTPSAMDAGRTRIPVGRPIDNVQIYVLDRDLNPVPIGAQGEVHIGGVGVARGYLNRPGLTAERFVPHPFSSVPGARVYKTGDVGRYLPDGTLELLGRLDQQVKIRGIRVELGEIEAMLCEHPAVQEAAVLLQGEGPTDQRLVAYVVARSEPALERRELRRFLQARLPAYMVPPDFAILDALPRTPNGKVDRRALPLLDRTALGRDRAFAAPRTAVEEELVGLWAQVLGETRVGIHDNFFELGGHSLLAGQLLARVRERFQVDVSLRAFFATPTVVGLAAAVRMEMAESPQSVLANSASEIRMPRHRGAGPRALAFAVQLPTDRSRPIVRTSQGARETAVLPAELTEALRELSRRERVTLFITLLAAFQAVLHRYAGSDDVKAQHRHLAGDPRFREMLERVRETVVATRDHQDLREKLVEALRPELSLSWTPLVQVLFTLEEAEEAPLDPSDLAVSPATVDTEAARFDLAVSVSESPHGLSVAVDYNVDLYDAGTIRRLLRHYATLLGGLVADPGQRLSTLPLLSADEREQLLVTWNRTDADYPRDRCIHELIETQAEQTPDAIAVVFEDSALTYRGLTHRANQLAHHLCSLGVGPEVPVGICVERSLDMLIGLLGILKAGGGCVPLDPALPSHRLAFMLEDTRASVLLTQRTLAGKIPTPVRHVVSIDGDWPTIARHAAVRPPVPSINPDNLAYIVYTSGSTGMPKGVAIAHRQIVNYSTAIVDRLTVNNGRGRIALAGSTFAMMKSFAVASCLTTIFPPLIAGGCVVVVSRERSINPRALSEYFARHPIDVLKVAPSHLASLLVGPHPEHVMPRQYLIIGGEASPSEWVHRLQTLAPACTILNHYGTTETSAGVLAYEVHGPCSDRGSVTPLGRPLANTHVYILDQHLQPVPVGAPGELHIAGVCLTRGYINRSDLTAEKFVPHPFSAVPGARLYKTGDLARYRPDGNIEFLGRRDHQLKIRGFRVEPGEVEVGLKQHVLVRDCAVVARQDSRGGTQLAAYVVPREPSTVTATDLRQFLKPFLPDYMIPTVFVFLDALPLTPHGKVDRRALPAPDKAGPAAQTPSVAPRTSVEEALTHIWKDLLGVQTVGVTDSFFELGGHSLLVGQLLARVRERFQVDVSLRAFFDVPTIAALGTTIVRQMAQDAEGTVSATDTRIPRHRGAGPRALSFAQQRLWFLDQLERENGAYNIPRAVRLQGALQVEALGKALNALVARHESLRTTFVLDGEEPVQVVAEQGAVALPVVDLGTAPESAREAALARTLRAEARRPFDLTTDLMLRALLVRLGARNHVLLLTVHHIASDGWSMRTLARELATLYRALTEGDAPTLPALPIRYQDYAIWQRGEVQAGALATQLSYWKAQLAGAPPTLALPTDRPRPAVQTYAGARETAVLGRDLANALHALSRRAQVTFFMTLLGGFAALLHRYAGSEDLVLGTATAGRRHVETEALVGFFANTLPIRVDLTGDPSFRALLLRVRETVVAAYDHQDCPFEKLVDELRPERSLSWMPLVQVVFTVQDPDHATMDLPGLVATPMAVDTGTAKFDLMASVREGPQGLTVTFEYNTDLYDAGTIRRLLGHYETLLRGIAADAEQRLSQLPLLTETERHQLLVDWNATQAPLSTACVHEAFEDQVRRSPDAVAVTSEHESLTYRELNLRANQLAHHLRERGVRPDTAVGVCLAPSVDLIAALLGILKAGGAYLPLDPAYPTDRLAFMLQDAQPVALVTRQEHLRRLPSVSIPIISLDHGLSPTASGHDPVPETTSEHLAYLMYTSGSTGRPKAVAVPHRAVTRLVQHTDYVQPSATDVVALASNASFDAATFEIWGALLNGARLAVFSREVVVSPAQLSAALEQQGVTLLFLTTALFNEMAREAPSAFQRLRALLIGGEPADPRWVQRVLAHGAPGRLLHMYGPTEATTFASWYHVAHVAAGATGLPIGRPIANTQIYLLDRHLNPVPIGVPGELHIGGPGVARGYVLRPQLSAEKFISNPFDAATGDRLYKTGDLARYLPDGNIEFLGRLDRQVKVRGYRVEPGEIEAQLGQHPGVRDVVVMVRGDVPDDKQLVAYVVPAQPAAPPTGELRRFLQRSLPSYMIPAHFVTLQNLPLTPNGKIDRRALPDPNDAARGQDPAFAGPGTLIEQVVAEMWAEVLAGTRVGVHDNFFELGGHSLLAGRLLARVRERFRVDVSLRSFFAEPTIAGVATAIVQQLAHRAGPGVTTRALDELRGLSDEQVRRLLGGSEGTAWK